MSRPELTSSTAYGALIATETVRLERDFPGPIERVWTYLVEPEKRRLWLADGPMEPHVGGTVSLVWRNSTLTPGDVAPPAGFSEESRASGTVTAWEPPHRLAFTWAHPETPETEATFELATHGDRVRVVVTHRRLVTDGLKVGVSAGWHAHLDVLRARLEDAEPPKFWASLIRLRDAYRVRYGL